MRPSSHHALLSLTLFLPVLSGEKEDLTAVCKGVFAAVPRGAGWWRLRNLPGVNPENGGWVRPLLKHGSSGEETSPATLLAVGITSFYRDRAGEHPWSTSMSDSFTPGLGWGGEHTSSCWNAFWRICIGTKGCCSWASCFPKLWWRCPHPAAPSGLGPPLDMKVWSCVCVHKHLYRYGCLPAQDSLLSWPVIWYLGISWFKSQAATHPHTVLIHLPLWDGGENQKSVSE